MSKKMVDRPPAKKGNAPMVLLIEWENYEEREPFSVRLLSRRTANAEASSFRKRRRRRADIIDLADL